MGPILFGIVCYLIFFGTFLYAIAFTGNVIVPKTIDVGGTSSSSALLNNLILLGLFAISHSLMARPWFKAKWTKIVPAVSEHNIYVLTSSLVLIIMFAYWQPMTMVVWNVENSVLGLVLTAMFWLGWLTVLTSTFMINHFELFGLQQVYMHYMGRENPKSKFTNRFLYKYVRHPIMLGFVVAFWAAPQMTLGHLLFAVATTGYIMIGIFLEEKDLLNHLGDSYVGYRANTSMLFPIPKKS